jgi:hypothetical protein
MAAENQTSSNNPFSVRMDEDEKQELLKLIQESGKGSKEFMSLLISSYKLSKTQMEVPAIAEDIKHLEAIVTQICEIYIGMGKRITTIEETNAMQYSKDIAIYREKVTKLEEDIQNVSDEKVALLNTIIKLNEDNEKNEKDLASLETTIQDKDTTIDDKIKIINEYKEKNDNLLGMLTDLNTYKKESETFKDLLAVSQAKNISLDNEIIRLKNEHENTISKMQIDNDNNVNKLTSKMKELDELLIKKDLDHKKELSQKDKELAQKDVDHSKELKNQKLSLEYEKDKALLEQEKHFNKLINDLKNENSSKIAAIQEQSSNQVLAYQKEIDTLLKSINNSKDANKSIQKDEKKNQK